jgi:tetratricopeptide (TPR) repeat protein
MSVRVLATALLFTLTSTSCAYAAVTVFGNGLAHDCSEAAFKGKSDADSIRTCDSALENETLDNRDRAGTFINRGVMYLRLGNLAGARKDFDASIATDDKIGEAWINRGAVSVAQKRYADGLSDINRGLTLGVISPEKAYYNRALAYEGLEDAKSAYLDYQQALTIKPDWQLPQQQLLRFTVTRR